MASATATQGLPDGTVEVPLRHRDRARPYLIHVPPALHDGAPLVIQLHGRGIGPLAFDRWTGFSALADDEDFVLAMPEAIDGIWNDGRYYGAAWPGRAEIDDVGYLLALIDDIVASHQVDPTRVYAVGMSNGAAMAGRLAWEQPVAFAAVAQVAGTASAALVADAPIALPAPVPVLEIHGTKDRWAPYAGGVASRIWARLMLQRLAGPSVGVDAWARLWVERNGADPVPVIESVGPDVTIRRWRGPSTGADVDFYRVDGGGHSWPGAGTWIPPHLGRTSRSFDATRVCWDFLAAHRRAPTT